MEVRALGALTFSEIRQQSAHSQRWVDQQPVYGRPTFVMRLQIEGASQYLQYGRTAHLAPGDFTLCDGARPADVTIHGGAHILSIEIPDALLRKHIPCPESVVAISMRSDRGAPQLLFSLLAGLWSEIDGIAEPESVSERLAASTLQLMAAAYADVARLRPDHFSVTAAQRLRILNYIEANLNDTELTPSRIATACRITARYLHHLFKDQKITVSRYILQRRLEESATALIAPTQLGASVTAIALDHGFNSPTHFGRVFRAKYGVTPREYRRTGG
jgi:AraC-like DNA-binding protein